VSHCGVKLEIAMRVEMILPAERVRVAILSNDLILDQVQSEADALAQDQVRRAWMPQPHVFDN
jgi:hypothetical protein